MAATTAVASPLNTALVRTIESLGKQGSRTTYSHQTTPAEPLQPAHTVPPSGLPLKPRTGLDWIRLDWTGLDTMSDDCANEWGRFFGQLDRRGGQTKLDKVVKLCCRPFELGGEFANGSTANLQMIMEATNGNIELCFFACGSYLAGDSGILQTLSTSAFDMRGNLARIETDETKLAEYPQRLRSTIAMPYHLPAV